MPTSVYVHVDVNNFYVSCERIFHPALRHQGIVVLSNNDGCVVSRSNEVKQLGIPMGIPWFQLQPLAKRHHIHAYSSNYALYGDMSRRVVNILQRYSPHIEIYSIDECFLRIDDIDPIQQSFTKLGQEIRQCIQKETSLPVCVGFAATKTLAKLANHFAKKRREFNGVCDLISTNMSAQQHLMQTTPIGELWGIGRQLKEKMTKLGIITVADVQNASDDFLQRHFNIVIARMQQELRGISCLALEDIQTPKQQILSSRSFGQPVNILRELEAAVAYHTEKAVSKLRAQHSSCQALYIFLQTNRFQTSHYHHCVTQSLPYATDDLRLIMQAAMQGVQALFEDHVYYKKTGVILLGIQHKSQTTSLFENPSDNIKSATLMQTMDQLKQRFGQHSIQLASMQSDGLWHAKFEHKSPDYTTSWQDLPKVK